MVFRKNYLFVLSLIAFLVWLSVFSTNNNLLIIACDVGQGDAILIQHKSDQVLIDGGPDRKVLDCLGRYMPFWDRRLELVINTHPESDHASGLIDVLNSYQVDTILVNDLSKPAFSSSIVRVLENSIGGSGVKVVHPYKGTKVRLGLMYLDTVHPYDEFQDSNVNNYSIVELLTFKDFKAIFTGDIENKVSDEIAENWKMGSVDYIKIPHHGSKNGISEKLLQLTKPSLAVISVGAKNSYSHPHEEVLQLLSNYVTKILRTDILGDVVVETDGDKFWVLN